MNRIYGILIMLTMSNQVFAQSAESKLAFANYQKYYHPAVNQPEKEKAIDQLRNYYASTNEVADKLNAVKFDWKIYSNLIQADGSFKDLIVTEKNTATIVTEAYNRLWKIADAFKKGKASKKEVITPFYLKSIIHYGNIEINRKNTTGRFHASCFAIPTATVNIYFCFLREMDDVERGENKSPLLVAACDMLKVVALQAWTQPLRNDATDENVAQVERFRHHVWWVGGNGMGGWGGYRAVLPVAVMYRSAPMIDVLAEVGINGVGSTTSQITNQTDFWTEGFTADGAGWGHGKQGLIWGYPIHGTAGALAMLNLLKDSPFKKAFGKKQVTVLMQFLRAANFYYYKGYILPCLDRGSMNYQGFRSIVPYMNVLNMLLDNFSDAFSKKELEELGELKKEAQGKNIQMQNYAEHYNGTRWFYNNDDLIKKNNDYHLIVNMASNRCDGLESADFADHFNFYTNDGLTLFQRTGDEYKSIYGAFDVTASPGVTAREGMDKLVPVTNWSGYHSKHNFAGAATSGGANAAAGFIFEKENAEKPGNGKTLNDEKNQMLFGLKAYKSWFMVGDYLIALGAGITNHTPNLPGHIRTTIEQTALTKEVLLMQNGKKLTLSIGIGSISVDKGLMWIKQQDKFAYALLPEFSKKLWYARETKTTDWPKMNEENKKKTNLPQTANILRLWVDHGEKPVNDQYGYIVYMGHGDPAAESPVLVAQNDTTLQAVQSKDGNVVAAVFYSAKAALKLGSNSLKVSAPCAVLIEKEINGYKVTVTDAEMNSRLKEIVVTLYGKQFSIAMPQGKECGKPVSQVFYN